MSTKANYFKIGLFFIISAALGVVAVVIWGAGLFTKDKIYFETYFDSAVTGLTPGSSVELIGRRHPGNKCDGQIHDIRISARQYFQRQFNQRDKLSSKSETTSDAYLSCGK